MACESTDQGSGSRPQRIPESYNNDPLYLQGSDFPGMQLVNVKLNGSNFQKWSRAVKIALKTKTKLGFIDGSCPKLSLLHICLISGSDVAIW